jgi:ribosomal protein S27E
MRRYEASRKPTRCPLCQAEQIGTLLYGMPVFSPELEARVNSGELILAGCCMTGDDPVWQCKVCGTGIYRKSGGSAMGQVQEKCRDVVPEPNENQREKEWR